MDASVSQVGKLFRDRLFVAASVQRDYQWEEKECQALLDDLDRAFLLTSAGAPFSEGERIGSANLALELAVDGAPNRDDDDAQGVDLNDFETAADITPPIARVYYLGAIALGPRNEERRVTIYDGLQRLTTLTLLLAVLRDLCEDRSEADALQKLIIDGQKPRIQLLVRDGSLFERVQRRNATLQGGDPPAPSDTGERIRRAVQLFRNAISEWPAQRRRGFQRFLVESVQFAVVAVDDTTLAFQLFYTTNTRGKRLESADILKAQILDLVARERSGDVVDSLASQWTGLQRRLGEGLEDYLRAMDFYYRRTRQREDIWSQELFDALTRKRHATRFVGWLVAGAPSWTSIQEAKTDVSAHGPLRASLRRLHIFGGDYWESVALAVLMGKFKRKADLLFRLEQACISIAIINEQGRDRPRYMAEAIAALARGDASRWHPYPLSKGKLDRVQIKLERGLDEKLAKRLVPWLEAWRTRSDGRADDTSEKPTLEHVLPQKGIQEHSQWRRDFPNHSQVHDYAWQLGNLAVVPADLNSAAGHKDFSEKITIYSSVKGRYSLLDEVIATATWTETTIKDRTKRMAAELVALLTVTRLPAA